MSRPPTPSDAPASSPATEPGAGVQPAVSTEAPLSKWQATRRQVRRVWALSLPYFSSEEKWKARLLLAAIVGLNLAIVYMNVLFNDWNKLFYDALQEKNASVFWAQLWHFCFLAAGFIVIAVYKFYLTQLLEMRWRAWMTQHYLSRWLSNQVFYRLELARFAKGPGANSGNPDNPDQRIQEDISQFTSLTIGLSMGLLNSVVTLVSFVGILWTLSGAFSFELAGSEYVVPGFMVWMALVYSLAGSVITHYIGRAQIPLNFEQQRLEAEFRHRMVRVREYSESIALDRGESVEREQLGLRFGDVLDNYLKLIRAQKRLTWFTVFFGQAAVVFPFFVAAPRYFSGAIQMGDLMQISSAFGQVQGAMGWFVDNYPSLAAWRATTDRLTSFEQSFQSIQAPTYLQPEAAKDADVAVSASGLTVCLPNGTPLVSGVALRVAAGDTVLLQGPSGSGKSTLFRTLAGIWPFASGAVTPSDDTMFLPQRPYLPNGPLRNALAYPHAPGRYTDAQLSQALVDATLPELASQLDRVDAWTQKLSGGEQQRLALARVLLRQPRWIFADEATSALDEATEEKMYARLSAVVQSQHGALVSIAHRTGVAAFHQRKWTLISNGETTGPRFRLADSAA